MNSIFNRNPCIECDYYIKENNTCQSKKCSNIGNPYITILDKLFCTPYKSKDKK